MGRRPGNWTPIIDRIMDKVMEDSNGCWIFTGHLNNMGYGTIGTGGKYGVKAKAHRLTYEYLVGPIVAGLELDHLCRVPACCNPDHLEPVTHKENLMRGPGAATHCQRGHEWNEENTYIRPDLGTRQCRACQRLIHSSSRGRNT